MRLLRRRKKEPDSFWCETLVENANAARMRGVEIAAPPELVFRWLCQLRVAAYSYDWADRAERRSRELLPGLDELELGQPVMGVYELADFVQGRELTIRLDRRLMAQQRLEGWYAPAATTYRVSAAGPSSTRLLAKSVTAFPRGLRWRLARMVVKPADRLLLKRQLRTLKRLAERDHVRAGRTTASVDELPLHVVALPARKRESVAN
jgi:hypothetical protein